MAEKSNKFYLDQDTQEDAEEFFCALETILSNELIESEQFRDEQRKHWGEMSVRRCFLDNTQTGKCLNCDEYPASRKEPFVLLKLAVPRSNMNINIWEYI